MINVFHIFGCSLHDHNVQLTCSIVPSKVWGYPALFPTSDHLGGRVSFLPKFADIPMFSNEKENMSARIEIYLQLNEKMIGQTNSQFG